MGQVWGRGKVAERSGAKEVEVEGGSGGGQRKKRKKEKTGAGKGDLARIFDIFLCLTKMWIA